MGCRGDVRETKVVARTKLFEEKLLNLRLVFPIKKMFFQSNAIKLAMQRR
jgi:hypothetical protein